ncbi:hypothetical protein [Nitrosomonas communis]|uniref:Big-1 domain-containing protein n=1 Tax=Nitrosomonas communis TaxID=44574 RepID=A0A1I4NBZ4_9PROT|nr:hypothetical protein [Nitrosomonas communis]SFM12915.1 hypothetical protein SAMN05421863_101431 [Nitrosomonas communis]
MLEILAGPYDLLDLEGNLVTDDSLQQARYYDDDVGLMFSEGRTLGKNWVIQLDGTACIRSDSYGIYVVDLQQAPQNEYLLIDALFKDKLYQYNKRAATREALLLSGGTNAMGDIQVRTQDRFLFASQDLVKWRPLDLSASAVTEATLTDVGDLTGLSINPVWSRTRHPDVLALAYENGNIIYYDHVSKTQAPGAAYIGTNKDAWYSSKYDIWLRLTSDRKLYVHASKPRPYALSNPTGSVPVRGKVTTYTVQLTGDAGEPCPDELIDWSLETGSVGQLKNMQSCTDANGYATVDYLAPVVGMLGNVNIKAELRF